mgnify:FL=1|tara:strand:+ start:940 stop:1203 length:264 start_codon:yes stop_codon:yes gene_type:complete
MRTASQRARDSIMAMYRGQLAKFKRLSVYDDDGNFLFGKTTEFGTKVTESLIKITQKRLHELVNMNLNKRGVKFIEDYTNDKTDEEV